MSPMTFLLIVASVTAGAFIVDFVMRKRRGALLSRLAMANKLHFCGDDRFNLGDRVAERLPTPGAADVKAIDVVYGVENDRLNYVFTAEYTQGTVRTKRRVRRVVRLSELKKRAQKDDGEISVSDTTVPVVEQYRALIGAAQERLSK